MVLFLLLFILCAGFGFVTTGKRRLMLPRDTELLQVGTDTLYLLACTVVLGLICGLRHSSNGVDTGTYISTFLLPDALNSKVAGAAKYEIGYVLFVKFLQLFSDNYTFFLMATAVVIFGGLFCFIRCNCRSNMAVALLVYVAFLYYVDFSAVRQAMALSIAINCTQYLRRQRWIPAVVIILVGASFQKTALLLLVMVPFAFTARYNMKVLIAMFLALLGSLLFEPLVLLVIKIIPAYQRYWESEMMQGPGGVGIFAILVILLTLYGTFMLFTGRIKFRNRQQHNAFTLALVGSVFTIAINLLGRKYGIFSRMTRYFIPYVMILAAEIYRLCIPKTMVDLHYIANLADRVGLSQYVLRFADPGQYPRVSQLHMSMKDLYYWLVTALMLVYFFTIMHTNLYQILPFRFFFQ